MLTQLNKICFTNHANVLCYYYLHFVKNVSNIFPFNISATAEFRDFEVGVQLRFAKVHHKIPRGRKFTLGPGLGYDLFKRNFEHLISSNCLPLLTQKFM